jgi:hypothetical protein
VYPVDLYLRTATYGNRYPNFDINLAVCTIDMAATYDKLATYQWQYVLLTSLAMYEY